MTLGCDYMGIVYHGSKEHEQYVDCSYVSICNAFPKLKSQLDILYENYRKFIVQEENIKKR